jgi:hypothetical protein
MFGAVAADTPWDDLASFGDIGFEGLEVLVIHRVDMIGAEAANLPAMKRFLFPPAAAGILIV